MQHFSSPRNINMLQFFCNNCCMWPHAQWIFHSQRQNVVHFLLTNDFVFHTCYVKAPLMLRIYVARVGQEKITLQHAILCTATSKCCKNNLQHYQINLIMLQFSCNILVLQKSISLQCFIHGPRATFFIHMQHNKCFVWMKNNARGDPALI